MRQSLNGLFSYELTCELCSPLCIGSGQDENSGHDVLLDFDGNPFIPGTSLAGVLRHYVRRVRSADEVNTLFGCLTQEQKDGITVQHAYQSPLIITDGRFPTDERFTTSCRFSLRDGVELDQGRTAKDEAKYNYEILEPGARFVFRIEAAPRGDCSDKLIEEILPILFSGIQSGEIRLGYKSNRGLGKFRITCLRKGVFSASGAASPGRFSLPWDAMEEQPLPEPANRLFRVFQASFKIDGTVMIRRYSTVEQADYTMTAYRTPAGDIPVIPGTSWAGVLRHAFTALQVELGLDSGEAERNTDTVFGPKIRDREDRAKASSVIVEDSVIQGGKLLTITRTMVDRLTGGSAYQSLYSERVCYGGTVTLTLLLDKTVPDWALGLLLTAIQDMEAGYLPIGGEISVGRGFMKLHGDLKLPGDLTQDNCLAALAKMIQAGGKKEANANVC